MNNSTSIKLLLSIAGVATLTIAFSSPVDVTVEAKQVGKLALAGFREDGLRAILTAMTPTGSDGRPAVLSLAVLDADGNDQLEAKSGVEPAGSDLQMWYYQRGVNEAFDKSFLVTATFSDGSTQTESLTIAFPGHFM